MCKAAGKFWGTFHQNGSTKAFLDVLATNVGNPTLNLIKSERGGYHTGTWVHPQVAIKLAAWCSPEFEVAVTDLVLRYSRGEVTTEESRQTAEQLGVPESWKPSGIGGVSNDLSGNQLYLGLPEGGFDNVRSMGSKAETTCQELARPHPEPVLVKFGRSDELPQRTKSNAAAFGGFKLLDHFETSNSAAAEKRLKRRLDAVGKRVRARHRGKDKEDFELVRVADQEEYEELYNLALWACTEPEDAAVEKEREVTKRAEWEAKMAIEHEKTEQMRIELERARLEADHEWRMRSRTSPQRDAIEEFAQSGLLIYEPGSYMKVSDLREAGNISSKTSVDALRDVFQARGVSFPSKKVRRLIPGQDKLCHTTWADGVRLATDNEME